MLPGVVAPKAQANYLLRLSSHRQDLDRPRTRARSTWNQRIQAVSRSRLKSIPRQGTRVSTSSPRISLSNLRSAVSAAAYLEKVIYRWASPCPSSSCCIEYCRGTSERISQWCWHFATKYEAFCAQALLTNGNPPAPGHEQPKSFSAWPRRQDTHLYHRASTFVQIFRKTCH